MIAAMYNLTTLHHLVDHDVRRLASAEAQLESILPDWIMKAGTVKLKNELRVYLDIVEQHVLLLHAFLNEENIQNSSRTNMVMQAHIIQTREQLCNCMDAEVADASLLASVQGINHYKIGMYGSTAAFARSLGKVKAANLFHNALVDEKNVDLRLSKLAEEEVNLRATAPAILTVANEIIQ